MLAALRNDAFEIYCSTSVVHNRLVLAPWSMTHPSPGDQPRPVLPICVTTYDRRPVSTVRHFHGRRIRAVTDPFFFFILRSCNLYNFCKYYCCNVVNTIARYFARNKVDFGVREAPVVANAVHSRWATADRRRGLRVWYPWKSTTSLTGRRPKTWGECSRGVEKSATSTFPVIGLHERAEGSLLSGTYDTCFTLVV